MPLFEMVNGYQADRPINTIIGNGKRFMAYALIKLLKEQGKKEVLEQLALWVNKTDKLKHKLHEAFEPSFDCKECNSIAFTQQKVGYIHNNPCRDEQIRARLPEDYLHSSAKYYETGVQGVYPVITYMELQDISLEKR